MIQICIKSLGGILSVLLGLGVLVAAPSSADASIIIDFAASLPAGDTGSPTYVDASGVVATAFYFDDDGGDWALANLYVRNEDDDHGLGICNPLESPCPGPEGGGNINEIDNDGSDELLRLSLPAGYRWVSVQLSSLDDNDEEDEALFERGQLWTSLSESPGDPFDSLLWEFSGGMEIEPTFAIPSGAATAPELFFVPFDWARETHTDNDFLVYKVEIERVDVPEPASTALLVLGLVAMGCSRRRQS